MYRWQDLVFDLSDPKDRASYTEDHGPILPLTHEADPIEHANKCNELLTGELGVDGYAWSVWARVFLDTSSTITDDGTGKPPPDVDFATLSESFDMMLRAHEHARNSSRPEAERPSKPPPSKPKTRAKRRR